MCIAEKTPQDSKICFQIPRWRFKLKIEALNQVINHLNNFVIWNYWGTLKCLGISRCHLEWKHLDYPYWEKTILIILNGRSQLHDVFNKQKF